MNQQWSVDYLSWFEYFYIMAPLPDHCQNLIKIAQFFHSCIGERSLSDISLLQIIDQSNCRIVHVGYVIIRVFTTLVASLIFIIKFFKNITNFFLKQKWWFLHYFSSKMDILCEINMEKTTTFGIYFYKRS